MKDLGQYSYPGVGYRLKHTHDECLYVKFPHFRLEETNEFTNTEKTENDSHKNKMVANEGE